MPRFDPNTYVDVQERINRFWSEYPDGRIVTELVSLPDDFERVVFRASIYKDRGNPGADATGFAAETQGGLGPNQTSWHENGETSAIGRALANMGYAKTREDRPSKQEMEKVARGPSPVPRRRDPQTEGEWDMENQPAPPPEPPGNRLTDYSRMSDWKQAMGDCRKAQERLRLSDEQVKEVWQALYPDWAKDSRKHHPSEHILQFARDLAKLSPQRLSEIVGAPVGVSAVGGK